MKNSFKTPALFNYLIYLSQSPSFCKSKDIILSYIPQFSTIDLNEDSKISDKLLTEKNHETYSLPINLDTNETINIIWDIDFLIKKIKSQKIKSQQMSIKEILKSSNIIANNESAFSEANIAHQMDFKFPHKINEIILTTLPVIPQLIVIDGNHRFFEAVIEKKDYVDTIIIPPEETIYFLLPNSHKLMLLWADMGTTINFNTFING